MPARPLPQIMNRRHRLAWRVSGLTARKTFFSAVRGDLRSERIRWPGRAGHTAVLCSSYEGESYVFQLSKSLTGRFTGAGRAGTTVTARARSPCSRRPLRLVLYRPQRPEIPERLSSGCRHVPERQGTGAERRRMDLCADQTGAQQGDSVRKSS